MPRRKKMETPSKQPKISTMMHEEEEEMQHDISKLHDQVLQISLSQKVTKANMDGLKNGIEDKIDGIKKDVAVFDDGLKAYIEATMNVKIEGLKRG